MAIRTVFLINSAPHDAQLVLSRVARRSSNERIVVIVSISCGLFDFFKNILKDTKDVFVVSFRTDFRPRISRPWLWLQIKIYIAEFCRELRFKIGDELWYAGDFCTLSMSALISAAKHKKVKIVDADHPQYEIKNLKPLFRERLHIVLNSLFLQTPIRIVSVGTKQRHGFLNSEKLGVVRIPGEISYDAIKDFYYKPDTADIKKNIIFFESASGGEVYQQYEELLNYIIEKIKECGWSIYIKPHPRLGASSFILNNINVSIIPQDIPGELIDYSVFSVAVAIYSVALVHTAILNLPSYCMEQCFSRKVPENVSSDLTRLLKNPDLPADAPLVFSSTIDEFLSFL